MEDRITLQKMEQERRQIFLGCDAHRKYSVFVTVDEREKASVPVRVEHDRPAFRRFLRGLQLGTPVALEATGSWYWLVDEMEEAGLIAHLAQPFAARRMLGAGSNRIQEDRRGRCTLLSDAAAQRYASGNLDSSGGSARLCAISCAVA
jgi:hypothetical protein